MNADQDYYDEHYKPRMEEYFWPFHFLNGKTEILASCDTLQVPDYSRYRMASWDETKKKAHLVIIKAEKIGAFGSAQRFGLCENIADKKENDHENHA